MAVPKELKKWIKDALDKGYSALELKEQLIEKEYDPEFIDTVFEEMKISVKKEKKEKEKKGIKKKTEKESEEKIEISLPKEPSHRPFKSLLILLLILAMLVAGIALIYFGLKEYLGLP